VIPLAVASAVALAAMLVVALWNLAAAPRLHRNEPAGGGVSVSVLVPARDEEANLARLLPALLVSRYPALEVVVLDDRSTDGTGAVAQWYARRDGRVSVLEGTEPPEGWTGKNWACHRLAAAATGEVFVFCDADVLPGPDAVGRTVAALARHAAGAVTAIPRHERGSWLEEAVVPLVAKLPVAALLPLPLVWRTASPALAMGNGQWFAWRRPAYRAAGGHASVRAEILEDVVLARRAKAAGVRLVVLVATRDLTVRMYRSAAALREGFAKNLYLLAGGRGLTFVAALLLFLLVATAPLALLLAPAPLPLRILPFALLATLRVVAALLFGEPLRLIVLHPVGSILVPALALESGWRHATGRVSWKGRRPAVPRE
jgi:glycosyltransferase involved in cell wall biosynthesis